MFSITSPYSLLWALNLRNLRELLVTAETPPVVFFTFLPYKWLIWLIFQFHFYKRSLAFLKINDNFFEMLFKEASDSIVKNWKFEFCKMDNFENKNWQNWKLFVPIGQNCICVYHKFSKFHFFKRFVSTKCNYQYLIEKKPIFICLNLLIYQISLLQEVCINLMQLSIFNRKKSNFFFLEFD